MLPTEKQPLELVLDQTAELYSPPEVALEVLRLTEAPEVDVRAIRDCLERDPALTAKLLRVVNSSLYGLSGEVRDLNQAIALLGVNPLKLLVLGFSLPDTMFAELMGPSLQRYWTDTVTRATAARLLAEMGWGRGGDEALLAGLMQGIGQLVLLQQFGSEYGDLLKASGQVSEGENRLAEREIEAIGFDHRTLSSELMCQWGLPQSLVDAVALQVEPEKLTSRSVTQDVPLAQPLRLAELLTQLVAHRRLSALPPLVEEGEAYCQLTRRQINTLVEQLQPQVDQLAEAMSVELEPERDYQAVLLEAHAKLSLVAEEGAGLLFGANLPTDERSKDDTLCDELLAETEQLSRCVREFMARRSTGIEEQPSPAAAHAGRAKPRRPHSIPRQGNETLHEEVGRVAGTCRQTRVPLALILVELNGDSGNAEPLAAWKHWLQGTLWGEEMHDAPVVAIDSNRFAMILPGVQRIEATRWISRAGEAYELEQGVAVDAGVSAIAVVPKGFEPGRLISAAVRCLNAAIATGAAAVKSIEVF